MSDKVYIYTTPWGEAALCGTHGEELGHPRTTRLAGGPCERCDLLATQVVGAQMLKRGYGVGPDGQYRKMAKGYAEYIGEAADPHLVRSLRDKARRARY